MAYDKELSQRIFKVLDRLNPPELEEKKMFGGIGYLVRGNMAVGVHSNELIVRVGTDGYPDALNKPGARPFDLTGRPMSGWVWVKPIGFESDESLQEWVGKGVRFALTLPPK
jgi:TfoX/Sxy family transcriptional regulator of competence genes